MHVSTILWHVTGRQISLFTEHNCHEGLHTVIHSGVANPEILGGGKMFDFRRITLFCLEKRLSKHKITIFSKHLGRHGPFAPPPSYAYGNTLLKM